MDSVQHGYARLIERFVTWAQAEDDIRAAMIVGSRARTDHPADEWSDLDLVVFAANPERYTASEDWLAQIGPYWLTFVEPTPLGGEERRVLFADGYDVDIPIIPVQFLETLVSPTIPPGIADLIRRGMRIVLDKDGTLTRLAKLPFPEMPLFQQPTAAEFTNAVSDFLFHTVWTAKKLRRGDLWWAKSCCDVYLKGLLHRALEWHAHATNGPTCDTWMRGRFLEEWADPRAVAALPQAFAHYDRQDIARALRATIGLFRWLAQEAAQCWGYSYPTSADQAATGFVERLLGGML
jgi:aminoglycoside 6-adenylyltransferase